jgi:hypothetical protein
MTSNNRASMATDELQTLLSEAAHHLHTTQDMSRVRQLAQKILSAGGSPRPACEVPWYDIASAPREIVSTLEGHNYGPYLLVAVGRQVVRARWWQSDRDPGVSNFIEDGGRACFPSAWTHLPQPPRPSAVLPSPSESHAKATRGHRAKVNKPPSEFISNWTKVIKES